jgi:hypothetical protein
MSSTSADPALAPGRLLPASRAQAVKTTLPKTSPSTIRAKP